MNPQKIGLKPEQLERLKKINELATEMEHIKNEGQVHGLVALLEELSNGYCIDIVYFVEKANFLFPEYRIRAERE